MQRSFDLPPLIDEIKNLFPGDQKAYLVGGSVRDLLLGRPIHDLDFALSGETRRTARRIAEKLDAGFFLLDDERNTCRVVYKTKDDRPFMLDFVVLAENDLETDLRHRDYTINAIAIDLAQPDILLDPCGGIPDLQAGLLRVCSPFSLSDDPLRILRGVRLGNDLNLEFHPETRRQMQENLPLLSRVSPERLRDELFRMLGGPQPAEPIKTLMLLGGIPYLLPELAVLPGVAQTAPHVKDVWGHTLDTLQYLREILDCLMPATEYSPIHDWRFDRIALRLARFRKSLGEFYAQPINPNRSRLGLLSLAALYHDVAKPMTQTSDEAGRLRAFGHDEAGVGMVTRRAQALQLSNSEVEYLQTVVRQHMRIHNLASLPVPPRRRVIYHYFRDTGPAGVDICLLSLADMLATYGHTLPPEVLEGELDVCDSLLTAWWEKPAESVRPVALVNGNDLIAELGLKPGAIIGQLLEIVREAQADGQIQTRQQALDLARTWLEKR
jgi:poly(A) polymerase